MKKNIFSLPIALIFLTSCSVLQTDTPPGAAGTSRTSTLRRSEFWKINMLVLRVATTFWPQRVGVAFVEE